MAPTIKRIPGRRVNPLRLHLNSVAISLGITRKALRKRMRGPSSLAKALKKEVYTSYYLGK